MKQKLFALSMAILLATSFSFATVRRIGYWGTALPGVDYADFASAQTASAAGDTLYFFPGDWGTLNITKTLVIIGPGYLLDSTQTGIFKGNDGLQFIKLNADANINFNSGSSGTKVYGMGGSTLHAYTFNPDANNIDINRCLVSNVYIKANVTNIKVQNCLNVSVRIATNATVANLFVRNNIGVIDGFGNIVIMEIGSTASGEISGNTSPGPNCNNSGSFICNNNIFLSLQYGNTINSNCVFNNNVINGSASSNPALPGSNNIFTNFSTGGNTNTVLQGYPFPPYFSADANLKLKAGSVAIGAGQGGIDAGAYGGTLPYKLSGIPPVPTIYNITSPQGNNPPGNTLQLKISTRANN